MKKTLTVIGLAVFLVSAQITFGDTLIQVPEPGIIKLSEEVSIPVRGYRGRVPGPRTQIAGFSYGDLLLDDGKITSASIEFTFSGNIKKLSQLDLYLDDILVLDFGEYDYSQGVSILGRRGARRAPKVFNFSYVFSESDFAALKDGEALLTLKGNPRAFRNLKMGAVTLNIVDPNGVPNGNAASVPEPATMLLLGSGLLGLAGYGRKRFLKK